MQRPMARPMPKAVETDLGSFKAFVEMQAKN